jgi:hypothetical protein
MWFTIEWCAVGAGILAGAVIAAAAYERGRAAMRREILAGWREHRCGECGAEPRAHLIHVSGCTAGWPLSRAGPESFALPAE